MKPLLRVNNLKTYFLTSQGTSRAVDGVSYSLFDRETIGIVGESGSGKSVSVLSILRLVPEPQGKIVDGEIWFDGIDLLKATEAKMREIRGNKISMIFQDPMTSLNPVFTIGNQISEAIVLHQGLNRKDALEQSVGILKLVRIPSPENRVHEYPYQLSGGMRQRAMIAMALACHPKILIADEPTTALDVTIQAQILELMNRIKEETGTAIIMITHNLGVIAEMAERVLVMYSGKIMEAAPVDELKESKMKIERMLKLKDSMKSHGIDCLILIPGPNLYYFSGLKMHTSERATMLFVNARSKDPLFLPKLEVPNAASILKDEVTYCSYSDEEGPDQVFSAMSRDLGLGGKKIGVEFLHMRVMEHELLKKHSAGFSLVNGEPLIAEIRMVKDDEEISCMRKAAEITEKALAATVRMIKPGMTELEIGNRFKIEALSFGSGEFPKEPIVASGPRSASPHTKASARTVNAGEMIIMDVGATFQGYICDLTRTFALGRVDDEFRKIYEIVKKANETVLKSSRPKFIAEELDKVARDVIEAEGYGQYFIHRTGHGLGIEEHEPPYIVKGNKLELKIGMTFTIEPGIYIPGKGGVRIEDNVVLTSRGLEKLTSYPTELRVL